MDGFGGRIPNRDKKLRASEGRRVQNCRKLFESKSDAIYKIAGLPNPAHVQGLQQIRPHENHPPSGSALPRPLLR